MYMDDANTRQIPSYSRADLQVSYRVRHDVRLTLDVRNAFRALYSTTGYADPAGSGAAFFFPAATRSLAVGMRYGW
jgi:outer membrane receptor protein involved in Fe transport